MSSVLRNIGIMIMICFRQIVGSEACLTGWRVREREGGWESVHRPPCCYLGGKENYETGPLQRWYEAKRVVFVCFKIEDIMVLNLSYTLESLWELKKIPVYVSHLQESKSISLVMWPRCLHASTYPRVCKCTCIHVCSSADFSRKPGKYKRFIQVIQQMLTSCTHYGIVLGNYR